MSRMPRHLTARSLILMVAGPIIWFSYFMAVYGLNGLRCALQVEAALFGINVFQYITSLLALVTVVLLLFSARVNYRGRTRAKRRLSAEPEAPAAESELFLGKAGLTLTFLSLVATVWVWLPSLTVPACV